LPNRERGGQVIAVLDGTAQLIDRWEHCRVDEPAELLRAQAAVVDQREQRVFRASKMPPLVLTPVDSSRPQHRINSWPSTTSSTK
jgi:hypothetical protein